MSIVQALIDSKVGVVMGTVLHTLGAIGLLGGLVAYIAWHRHLQKGHHHANVLAFATFLTYLSIVVNLVGGFMRTYETGHPSITQFADSSWVRAIAIKHVFLFAGMGAAVVLLERVAPRHLKAMWDGKLPEQSMTGHTVGVLFVTLGIVVASLLGAVSTVIPLAMAEAPDDEMEPVPDAYLNATGNLQSTPLAPGSAGGDLPVPEGLHDIEVVLTWSVAQANLAVELVDPNGVVAKSIGGSNGRAEGTLDAAPAPGTWTYRITSPDPVVNTQWALAIHMPAGNGTEHGH